MFFHIWSGRVVFLVFFPSSSLIFSPFFKTFVFFAENAGFACLPWAFRPRTGAPHELVDRVSDTPFSSKVCRFGAAHMRENPPTPEGVTGV